MQRRASTTLCLGSVAVVGLSTLMAGMIAPPNAEPWDATELIDPRYVAANRCSGLGADRNELFKPGTRLLLTSAPRSASENAPSVPLYEGLGPGSFPVTTASDEAQQYLDQGLKLAAGFNHAEAVRSFRAAQAADPTCAMCYWGEAYALGPNINMPMATDAVRPAFAAVAQAQALAAVASPLEQALINALAHRYVPDADIDRALLDVAYADAMTAVAAKHPDNPLVLVLAAEALMNTQPWDYWEADKRTPKGQGGEIVRLLEAALAVDPDNTGAIHLYIHAVEASATPERAEPHADRLRDLVSNAGHLVHMPSHIYYRVGRYQDSLRANRAAVLADERFLAQVDDNGIYRFGYYPHNVHYLLVSAQMAGAADDALSAADKLANILSDELAAEIGWIQAIKTAPYTVHVQFSDPATILALPEPHERFPFVNGFRHYARGIAQVRAGDLAAARVELDAIDALRRSTDFSALEAQYVPAGDLLTIARHVVEARIAAAEGRFAQAVALLEAAAGLQDTVPYMEPPYWYYPVRQTLGAVLHAAGEHEAAARAYKASLIEAPNNGWALWGLEQVLLEDGDRTGAAAMAELRRLAWSGDEALLTAERL